MRRSAGVPACSLQSFLLYTFYFRKVVACGISLDFFFRLPFFHLGSDCEMLSVHPHEYSKQVAKRGY